MRITDKGYYLEFYYPDASDARKESAHQIEAISHLRVHHDDWLFWHSKNEGKKNIATAMMDAQEGLLKGVSDIVILMPQGGKYHFAAIEMKRVNKSGKGAASPVSKDQKAFLRRVREIGGFAAVAYGSHCFKAAIKHMLSE